MASLEVFARRIRERADRIEDNVNLLVGRTAIAINQVVVLATPVDTGRARANWQLSIDVPAISELTDTDKSGQETINKNNARATARRSGQTIYLTNNLNYIQRLNQGHSAQAPANFVEEAIQLATRTILGARIVT